MRALILILALVFPSLARAQFAFPGGEAILGAAMPAPAGDCAVWISNSSIVENSWTADHVRSQSITTAGESICKVSIYAKGNTGGSGTIKIEFRTASNGGGTLLCESSSMAIAGSAGWCDANVTGTLNTGTAYLTVVNVSGDTATWYCSGWQNGNDYAGGSFYSDTNEDVNRDWAFKVWK